MDLSEPGRGQKGLRMGRRRARHLPSSSRRRQPAAPDLPPGPAVLMSGVTAASTTSGSCQLGLSCVRRATVGWQAAQ